MKTLILGLLTLGVGLFSSCVAQPSKPSTTIEQLSSEETGMANVSEEMNRWSHIKEVNYSGKRADRAEIAGMMATFMVEPSYKASYIYIVNEYGGDELIRQNGCAFVINDKSKYDMLYVSISPSSQAVLIKIICSLIATMTNVMNFQNLPDCLLGYVLVRKGDG